MPFATEATEVTEHAAARNCVVREVVFGMEWHAMLFLCDLGVLGG